MTKHIGVYSFAQNKLVYAFYSVGSFFSCIPSEADRIGTWNNRFRGGPIDLPLEDDTPVYKLLAIDRDQYDGVNKSTARTEEIAHVVYNGEPLPTDIRNEAVCVTCEELKPASEMLSDRNQCKTCKLAVGRATYHAGNSRQTRDLYRCKTCDAKYDKDTFNWDAARNKPRPYCKSCSNARDRANRAAKEAAKQQ